MERRKKFEYFHHLKIRKLPPPPLPQNAPGSDAFDLKCLNIHM
jgi:hypothetical protein